MIRWDINTTDLEYTIEGYEYRTYLEVEDDNQKLFHFCFKDGEQVEMPLEFNNFTPYERVNPNRFRLFLTDLVK